MRLGGRGPAVRGQRWALWSTPPMLCCLVLGLVALAAGSAFVGAATTPVQLRDVLTWLALLGCGAVCVEAMRGAGEPAGLAKDLLSAWTLPVALLLPPVYSLLISLPLTALRQRRVERGLLYRRAYSVAAVGLANGAVSVVFHRYLAGTSGSLPTTATGRTQILAVALACAAGGCLLNLLLIATAVRIASPATTWRALLLDREQRVLDVGETCLGLVVAGCWFLTPVLALAMLVPVLLVQRSLSYAQLRAAARTDAKTGLLTSVAWQQEAEREIVRARREGQPLAVLIADLDHFKQVNDVHGHLAGDVALRAAVAALSSGLRPYDTLGRFGGEEFTAVLPHTDHAEAVKIAERLRRAVNNTPVNLSSTTLHLSISIGVAILGPHGEDLTDLLTAADHALYRAKDSGRDQVALAL